MKWTLNFSGTKALVGFKYKVKGLPSLTSKFSIKVIKKTTNPKPFLNSNCKSILKVIFKIDFFHNVFNRSARYYCNKHAPKNCYTMSKSWNLSLVVLSHVLSISVNVSWCIRSTRTSSWHSGGAWATRRHPAGDMAAVYADFHPQLSRDRLRCLRRRQESNGRRQPYRYKYYLSAIRTRYGFTLTTHLHLD